MDALLEGLHLFFEVVYFVLQFFFDLLKFFATDVRVFHHGFQIGKALRQTLALREEALIQFRQQACFLRIKEVLEGLYILFAESHIGPVYHIKNPKGRKLYAARTQLSLAVLVSSECTKSSGQG